MSFSLFLLYIIFSKQIIEVDNKSYAPIIEEVLKTLAPDLSDQGDASFIIKYLMQFPFINYVEVYRIGDDFFLSCKTKPILKEIKFSNFKKIETEWLLRRISLRPNEYYTKEEFLRVKEEIEELLKKDGYVTVNVEVSTKLDGESAILLVNLKSGKRHIIKEVLVEGGYESFFKGLKGTDFSKFLIEEKMRTFKEHIIKKGFLDGDVEWEGIEEEGMVLKINVHLGKRFVFKVISNYGLFTNYDFKKIAMKVNDERGFLDADKILAEVKEILARMGLDKTLVKIKVEESEEEKIYTLFLFESRGLFVKKIKFEGRRSIPEGKLKKVMRTKEKRWYKRIFNDENGVLIMEWLKEDIDSIKRVYRDTSFPDADVRLERIVETKEGYEIVIRINEGKRYVVDEMVFPASISEVIKKKPKKISLPAGVHEIEKYLINLRDSLKSLGFLESEISVERILLSETENELHLKYIVHIKEGEKYIVGNLFFMGNKSLKNHLLNSLLSDIKNSPLTPETRLKTYTRLSLLDYFKDINIKTLEGSRNGKVDIGIRLIERPKRRLSFGFGYATEEGARAFGGLGFFDILGEGIDISLYGKVASWVKDVQPLGVLFEKDNYELSVFEGRVEINKKVFFHRNLIAGLIGDYKYINRPAFEIRFLDISFVNRAEVFSSTYLTGGYTFRRREPLETSPEYADESGFTIVGFLFAGLLIDRRDNQVLPEKGFIFEIRSDLALQELISEGNYVKFLAKGKEYIPLNSFLNLRIINRIGYAKSWPKTFRVPKEERFFLGGSNSIRGFEEDSVCPKDPVSGEYLGGNFMVNYGLELSIRATRKLSFALFLEGGGAFEDWDAFDTKDLREGAGFGVRWSTPIGEMAGDMGFKLDRRAGEKINVFHFSVGRFL